MDVLIKEIGDIKPNPDNPRFIRDDKFKKLKASIESFPEMLMKRPIVCFHNENKELVALGGNMRLRALQDLGYNKIPVMLADEWSEEQKRQFLITDNVGYGEWDWDILANSFETTELENWGLDVIKHDWDNLDFIDEAEKPVTSNESITIVVTNEHLANIDEMKKDIRLILDSKYAGCDFK